jgi:hypothetical protein
MLPQHVLLALVAAVSAVPLNINLGAYSPALVVGDGEISLGSKESASELMATLATGAQSKGEGAAAAKQGQPEQSAEKPAPIEVVAEPAAEKPKEGETKAEEKAAKRSPDLINAINDILRKRSAPAEDEKMVAVEKAMDWIKRDLQSFEAALKYAGEAMKNQPKVEMGSEGVGVGLVVSPGVNVPKDSAANGKEARVKRDGVVAEEGDSPKMTLVAITEV